MGSGDALPAARVVTTSLSAASVIALQLSSSREHSEACEGEAVRVSSDRRSEEGLVRGLTRQQC